MNRTFPKDELFTSCTSPASSNVPYRELHNLVLCDASSWFCLLHCIPAVRILILDKCKAKGTSAVLVASEFGCRHVSSFHASSASVVPTDGCLGILGSIKLHHSSTTGATIGFILDLSSFDFSDGCEKFD